MSDRQLPILIYTIPHSFLWQNIEEIPVVPADFSSGAPRVGNIPPWPVATQTPSRQLFLGSHPPQV